MTKILVILQDNVPSFQIQLSDDISPVPPSPTNTNINWMWGSPWAAIVVFLPEASPGPSDS